MSPTRAQVAGREATLRGLSWQDDAIDAAVEAVLLLLSSQECRAAVRDSAGVPNNQDDGAWMDGPYNAEHGLDAAAAWLREEDG